MKLPLGQFRLSIITGVFFLMSGACAFAQETGTWQTKSSISFTGPSDGTASVINGKIYVMGGDVGGYPTNILEVYDAATDTWSTPVTTGTFTARDGLTSSVVNGKIYVMGGYDATSPNALNTLEVFDPATNTWSTPVTTGTFTGRGGLSSAVVNGKIYVMGGSHSDLAHISNTLEVFDPASNTWSTPATTGTFSPRGYFAASVVNGKIYTMGGTNSAGLAVNTFEVFDPATNTWTTPSTTGTFSARADLASGVINGKIYAIGGHHVIYLNTFEEFDPATNMWSTPNTSGTVTARNGLVAGTVNGVLYALGGSNGNDLNTNEAYIPHVAPPPLGYITLAASQLNFGSHDYTKDSILTAMIHNPSASAVSIDSAIISGTNAGDFTVLGNTKQVNLPYSLAAGDSIGFLIQYTAPSVTETDNASLQIFFDQSHDSVRTAALSGSSQKPAASKPGYITLSITQLNFGVHDYTKDSSLTEMIHNPSASAVSIDQTMISGANQTDFKVLSNTKQANLPYVLQPGDSIGFILQYTAPSATENDNATLQILFDQSPDSARSITLLGSAKKPSSNGIPALGSTGTLSFSCVPNPAVSQLKISYSVPVHAKAKFAIFDVTGKLVADITGEEHDGGTYTIVWDISTIKSGSYILQYTCAGESQSMIIKIVK